MRRSYTDEAIYQAEKARRWSIATIFFIVVALVSLIFALSMMDHPEARPSDTFDGISEGFDK